MWESNFVCHKYFRMRGEIVAGREGGKKGKREKEKGGKRRRTEGCGEEEWRNGWREGVWRKDDKRSRKCVRKGEGRKG